MRAKERLPRKRYYPEFKMEMVRLALEEEVSVAEQARQHDVNDNLLFKWIRLCMPVLSAMSSCRSPCKYLE